MIDSLNSISSNGLTSFIAPLIRPYSTLVAIYHTPTPDRSNITSPASYAPSLKTQLLYLATTIIAVSPNPVADIDEEDVSAGTLLVPLGAHSRLCQLQFTHRRKSGRAVEGSFEFDFTAHEFTFIPERAQVTSGFAMGNDDSLIKDLTTFNLGMTEKQRIARDGVDLPYLAAQEGEVMGATVGGAIVYQFEKEDDYDEEDPYEDPI